MDGFMAGGDWTERVSYEDDYEYIARNVARVRADISEVCHAVGHDPNRVTLLAAVKTANVEQINFLHRKGGVCCVGENRVRQLTDRYEQLAREGLRLHFIGSLQTNKVKYIIDKVDMIESLDSDGLAAELQRQALKHDRTVDVLIEINIGREPTKGGVMPEDADAFVRTVCEGYDRLRVKGFMTMAPKGDERSYRTMFGNMRRLSERLWSLTPQRDSPMVLSMGMSDSYRYAVAEGATLIRVGRALFQRDEGQTPVGK